MECQTWTAPDIGLRPEDVTLWNAAMSHAGHMQPLGSSGAELCFYPMAAPADDGPVNAMWLDGKPFGYIRVDRFPFQHRCGVDLDMADLDSLPEDIVQAIKDGMFSTLLSCLPHDLRSRLHIDAVIGSGEILSQRDAHELQWLSCELNIGNMQCLEFTFAATRSALCAEIVLRGLPPRIGQSSLSDFIAMRIERLLGTAVFLTSELCSIAAGDCMLFSRASEEGDCAVLADGRVFLFSGHDAEWICSGAHHYGQFVEKDQVNSFAELEVKTPSVSDREEGLGSALVDLPIEVAVSFCLGSCELAMSEIQAWQPGAVVTLPEEVTNSDTLVSIRANGVCLAEGDLVRVGDRLAVRLSRTFFNPHHRNG